MNCVKFLYDSLLRDLQGSLDAPLLVNTMGWIRDVGALLLVDIIRLVIEFHFRFMFKNFEIVYCRL